MAALHSSPKRKASEVEFELRAKWAKKRRLNEDISHLLLEQESVRMLEIESRARREGETPVWLITFAEEGIRYDSNADEFIEFVRVTCPRGWPREPDTFYSGCGLWMVSWNDTKLEKIDLVYSNGGATLNEGFHWEWNDMGWWKTLPDSIYDIVCEKKKTPLVKTCPEDAELI